MTSSVVGTDNLALTDVKAHLYVDTALDDTLLLSYISASLSVVKNYIHTDVLLTEYASTATEVANNLYYMTHSPKLVKADNVDLTRDQFTHYDGRLYITDKDILATVTEVKAYTGFTVVPEHINQARKLIIGEWYDNRESNVLNTKSSTLPHGIEFILDSETAGAI